MLQNKLLIKDKENIENKIYFVRNAQVMLDSDLANLYGVATRSLNQQVKRNINRFPKSFCFRLSKQEFENLMSQNVTSSENLKSQIATSKKHGGRRTLPFVFTEQGVAMLAGILNSEIAVYMSIRIINAFVAMRKIITANSQILTRLDNVERKQIEQKIDTDKKFEQVFNALSSQDTVPSQKIFFDGQIFDAYYFVSKIIRSAKKKIILIDNFIDETVLNLFTKKKRNIRVIIYTKNISRLIKLDIEKFNAQYKNIELKEFTLSHDRFLIIDNTEIYHFGASMKDLGKKWFAFSKFDKQALILLDRFL